MSSWGDCGDWNCPTEDDHVWMTDYTLTVTHHFDTQHQATGSLQHFHHSPDDEDDEDYESDYTAEETLSNLKTLKSPSSLKADYYDEHAGVYNKQSGLISRGIYDLCQFN